MLHVALWEPEIPPNTGNIARLCAANAVPLHLIGRLGFRLDDRDLKRAGCDYWPLVDCRRHTTFDEFRAALPSARIIPVTVHTTQNYAQFCYQDGDCILFGSESKGLPDTIRERFSATAVTIPMTAANVRSLNLATAVGIVLYEALRQRHGW
jgi:tRNA (cytidine/uridine-2'-O-)-methyltransferase